MHKNCALQRNPGSLQKNFDRVQLLSAWFSGRPDPMGVSWSKHDKEARDHAEYDPLFQMIALQCGFSSGLRMLMRPYLLRIAERLVQKRQLSCMFGLGSTGLGCRRHN